MVGGDFRWDVHYCRVSDDCNGVISQREKVVSEKKTVVVFRKWKDNGDIIALFPDIKENNGTCSSYEHIGQHGEADYVHCIAGSRPATPNEAQDLLKELRGLGYNLEVRSRRVRK